MNLLCQPPLPISLPDGIELVREGVHKGFHCLGLPELLVDVHEHAQEGRGTGLSCLTSGEELLPQPQQELLHEAKILVSSCTIHEVSHSLGEPDKLDHS